MGSISFPSPPQCRAHAAAWAGVVLFWMERKRRARFVLTALGWKGRWSHHAPTAASPALVWWYPGVRGCTGLLTVLQKIRG